MDDQPQSKKGLFVSHLMLSLPSGTNKADTGSELSLIVEKYRNNDVQIIASSVFGFECDLMLMCLTKDDQDLWLFEQDVKKLDLILVDSFLSVTELSEYATTEQEERARVEQLEAPQEEKDTMMEQWLARMAIYEKHRLYPELPPKEYICFYPMSKKREAHANWYSLSFDERAKYMRSHGTLGRKYSGKILQLITGATGLSDWEWGVSLFSDSLVDIKDIVYDMRFDEASALYAEFGHFTIGKIVDLNKLFS
jgi:peroxiredoxin